ncbi:MULTISPECIES: formate--tetrahydrofolate ligase [Exiguobacterium]|uniref:formate--tetrahydrofolate ligase n=1 Tax=Exiguobacterium TaxID=33986 RepID=UPI001BED32CF|nr:MULTISPECIES: formate--tetrahydrofolate ligase [Exiguobacterium]MCT4776920.1 formate--tetrahydrofolate ligase [Exiguobacterium aquaticum]MCT4789261.1 formate--tetrahydrofolate ligase [Exiguobacterium mexicanum]
MTTIKPLSDLTIAQQAEMLPVKQIAEKLGLQEDDLDLYGKYKAKLSFDVIDRMATREDGKLILVTAINPTPAGEGKSTVTVGLGQALNQLDKQAIVCLREPSLGPTMGLKGGAAGGGFSQVLPMEDINLHFTGDMHAITAAHNTISAMLDNHLHQGNDLGIDVRKIVWKRVLDLNDRALRHVTIGLGGSAHGVPREDGFDITVASEIMAILCLADSLTDLEARIKRIVVAYDRDNEPITAEQIGAAGAATLLLKEAFKPNLVQTLEQTPALVHGGPFANIAHGCNSLIATKTALKLGDYVVTEAGFGADLGAEKFCHIKSRIGKLNPDAVVLVATVRALKMHGGVAKDQLHVENVGAVGNGLKLLAKHVETMGKLGLPTVVALNRFNSDTAEELAAVLDWCEANNIRVALSEVWSNGGQGGRALAEAVIDTIESNESAFTPLYALTDTIEQKILTIAREVYGAADVTFTATAKKQMAQIEANGWQHLPICMAKTPFSLSDDPTKLGYQHGFTVTVRELKPSVGAGFLVALTGNVLTMPGLPKQPAALNMGIDETGKAIGLF